MNTQWIEERLARGYDGLPDSSAHADVRVLLAEVETLRADRAKLMGHYSTTEIAVRAHEAMAAEVQALRAEVERLRAALLDVTCDCGPYSDPNPHHHDPRGCRYMRICEEHRVPHPTTEVPDANHSETPHSSTEGRQDGR